MVRIFDYKFVTIDGKTLPEHRYLMQQLLGRELLDSEVVHHKNGDCRDNRIENLVVMGVSEHCRFHAADRRRTTAFVRPLGRYSRKKMRCVNRTSLFTALDQLLEAGTNTYIY